jgi:chromosome segregation ATPase
VAIFEDAAEALVNRLESLDDEITEAKKRFAAHHQALAALDEQMAADWNDLSEEVSSFLHKVQEEAGLLNQDGNEALRQLSELQNEINGSRSEAEGELEGSRDDVKSLAEHIRALEPPLDALVANGAETPFGNLRDLAQDVERQLEAALNEARDFLQLVATDLETVRGDIDQRSDDVRGHVTGECVDNLQNAYAEWEGHVEELEALVEAKFEELPQNAREVVEYAMTECTAGHEEEFNRLGELVEDIDLALQALDGTVGETETDIGEEAYGSLDERLGGTSQAVARTIEALDRVKGVLAGYTFVQM